MNKEPINADQRRIARAQYDRLEAAVINGDNWQRVMDQIALAMAFKGEESLKEEARVAREYMRSMFEQLHGVAIENYQRRRQTEEHHGRGLSLAERARSAQGEARAQPQGRGRSR